MFTFSVSLEPSMEPTSMDFRIAKFKGQFGKIIAAFTGHKNHLLDIKTLTKGKTVCGHRYTQSRSIDIDQIKGSEGRAEDFDQKFHPLKSHTCDRWLNIARAWQRGLHLPAIDLIKVNDVYIVRDGHHRISVARYLGCKYIDAHVTEWVLSD
jgi:hypothetical protein